MAGLIGVLGNLPNVPRTRLSWAPIVASVLTVFGPSGTISQRNQRRTPFTVRHFCVEVGYLDDGPRIQYAITSGFPTRLTDGNTLACYEEYKP